MGSYLESITSRVSIEQPSLETDLKLDPIATLFGIALVSIRPEKGIKLESSLGYLKPNSPQDATNEWIPYASFLAPQSIQNMFHSVSRTLNGDNRSQLQGLTKKIKYVARLYPINSDNVQQNQMITLLFYYVKSGLEKLQSSYKYSKKTIEQLNESISTIDTIIRDADQKSSKKSWHLSNPLKDKIAEFKKQVEEFSSSAVDSKNKKVAQDLITIFDQTIQKGNVPQRDFYFSQKIKQLWPIAEVIGIVDEVGRLSASGYFSVDKSLLTDIEQKIETKSKEFVCLVEGEMKSIMTL